MLLLFRADAAAAAADNLGVFECPEEEEWTSTGGEPNSKTFSEIVEMFLLEDDAGLAIRLAWSAYLTRWDSVFRRCLWALQR